MTKKKRELIDILLDNITPDDWPEIFPYAVQDKFRSTVYVYANVPDISSIYDGRWDGSAFSLDIQVELCKFWNKTIVHRDEFMKRWNERNAPGEVKTPQQLALEKFGTDWHDNDGKTPPLPEGLTIDIEFKNGTIRTDIAKNDSDFDIPYYADEEFTIKRWRIHSATNATTPPAQQELHIEEAKPIQQEVKATDTQVGGDHYTKLAIQPMRYSMENGLDPLQHTIIKYVTRFRDKAGIEDLEKAKHCIDMLIEFERDKK